VAATLIGLAELACASDAVWGLLVSEGPWSSVKDVSPLLIGIVKKLREMKLFNRFGKRFYETLHQNTTWGWVSYLCILVRYRQMDAERLPPCKV